MMLFIPFTESTHHDANYCQKMLYNHNQFNGEEAAFIIGGFRDLQMLIKIRNGKEISLHTLLKGIAVSQGMSRPLLFQHIKPNSSDMVTMAIYQTVDHDQVIPRQVTLEKEIKQVTEYGQERNVFINPDEGI
jgi:hypothetical protein